MFKTGLRVVHKDSPNVFDKSWEIIEICGTRVMLGGPGAFETSTSGFHLRRKSSSS